MIKENIKILIACEESQAICTAFRERGFTAYSCDIMPCSGGHPEWHLQQDVIPLLNEHWDLIIAHPPCTYLTVTGNRWFNEERYGAAAIERKEKRKQAADFFMKFVNCQCEHVAIENPIGFMSTYYRKPDQIIQPYYFGHHASKATCLWLKNLPALIPTDIVNSGEWVTFKSGKRMPAWYAKAISLPREQREKIRSRTFPGIAEAIAEQWGNYLLEVDYD